MPNPAYAPYPSRAVDGLENTNAGAGQQCSYVQGVSPWVRLQLDEPMLVTSITIVHRTDMLQHIIARIARSVGDLTLLPLWPREGLRR